MQSSAVCSVGTSVQPVELQSDIDQPLHGNHIQHIPILYFTLTAYLDFLKGEGCREPPRYDTTLKWLGRVVHSVQTSNIGTQNINVLPVI